MKAKLQSDVDAAVLATAKEMLKQNETQLRAALRKAVFAQKYEDGTSYILDEDDITINIVKNSVGVVVRAQVPTSFLRIIRRPFVNVAVASSVVGPSTSFVDVNIVLDKSSSMLLAATASGQAAMQQSQAKCVFACHTVEGGPWVYNGASYSTGYSLSRAMGVKLRSDVAVSAAKEVLAAIAAADPAQARIRVGLYTIGTKATQVLAPTFSILTAKEALDDDKKGLNSATSEDGSRFDTTIAQITSMVGTAGDGSSASSPLKLVLLLTDGIISQRDWVLNGVWWDSQGKMHGGRDWPKIAPVNPNWCSAMKAGKATVGVLHTEYLAIPSDEGYLHTVGNSMTSADWKSIWGGNIRPGVPGTVSRRDYVSKALQDCASSPELFVAASDANQIESGLSALFKSYIAQMRLTM